MTSRPPRERSIVIGGGLAGIAAAAALVGAGHEVSLVEKDLLDGPGSGERRGVPQAEQLHNLLTCAQLGLERLLPGFGTALRSAGAGEARVGEETEVFELGERMPGRDLGMRLICAPRLLIERVARRLLLAAGGVTVHEGARALGLELSPAGAVAGAALEVEGERRSLPGSIVVDATGSRAAACRWLEAAGLERPGVDSVRVERWYVTAQFERPPGHVGRNRFWLVFPTSPNTRGGLVSPSHPQRWHVSLSGGFEQPPPRTAAAMRDYAATLEAPWIAELLAAARAASKPRLFRKPRASWRRYDRVPSPLPGLLPIGDAFASLNPLFGQGVSVAARQAVGLAELLAAEPRREVGELTSAYLERAGAAVRAAWELGELVDPAGQGAAAAPRLPDDLAALIGADAELHRLYVGAWHLVEPTSALFARIERLGKRDRRVADLSLAGLEGSVR